MVSLSVDKDAKIIEAFNSTSRYLDNLLNFDNTYSEGMVSQIYPSELQLLQISVFIRLSSVLSGVKPNW